MAWIPKRTLAEVEAILCGPGQLHEVEKCVVDGRVQRVYKNAWQSLRHFWLWAAAEHSDRTHITFEGRKITFRDARDRSAKVAAVLQELYDVQKGDRVVICSRNYPDYLVAFWACHLIGAVSVLVNAWLPLEPTMHCLIQTQAKVVIMDPPRADLLEHHINTIARKVETTGFLVWEQHEGKGKWEGIENWSEVLDSYQGDPRRMLIEDPGIAPEDNATIIFTSGTTGLPKGVLSTQRMFLTNIINVVAGSRRAILRRGESPPQTMTPDGPQKGILISVPLFHVTGTTSMSMVATMTGMNIVLMRKWVPEKGELTRYCRSLIRQENVAIAGGVPSMAADLLATSAVGQQLDGLLFGGAPAPEWLAKGLKDAFPDAALSQAYGLTETNSVAVSVTGEDYITRSTCAGLATPVNDILIVKDERVVPPGELGEVWLRGPNVMKEYWGDPIATKKVITQDGWLRSGDIGFVDHEGFLYIRDRIKDLILRGGENIDSVSVENAVSADHRLLEVAAVGVPDRRLGELVAVVASVKAEYRGRVYEEEVIRAASQRLPRFAVPVMVILQDDRLPRNPSGKVMKVDLRLSARDEWQRRQSGRVGPKL
ncbi:acetyl-CoA synthetase-like protein [Auriscalpium vulgare]|uniref:Acetyl-CoA synthetase-like protein n=1 Tax=Auriscalpium vulgare TaxID=40419 RepID=A0ACB8SCK4_9AGAM|nr:acetyl-CoA synthetase-like protein [Auriscalpium vulgare]